MFPLTSNEAYIKPTGERSTLGAELGGSSYTLPTAGADTKGGVKIGSGLKMTGEVLSADQVPAHTVAEAGKVLTVADDGSLEWDIGGAGGGDGFTELILPGIEPRTNNYRISIVQLPLKTTPSSSPGYNFTGSYNIDEVFLPQKYSIIEFYGDLRSSDVTALNLTLLAEALSDAVTEVVLSDSISNFDAILIQGCYDSSGVSNYDTTVVYSNPQLTTPYWFGMKDRNASYSGTITFSDATHATLSASRRLKIYGFNL